MSEAEINNGKTPKREKGNFFNSLLCFCKWGSDNKNDNVQSDNDKPRTAIKTRIPRVNHDYDDTSSQCGSMYDNSTTYTDASESVFSDSNLPNINGEVIKKSTKRRKNKKKGSNRSSSSVGSSTGSNNQEPLEPDYAEIKKEFIMIMSGGMNLLAATAMGSTRAVTVVTDGITLSWGLPKSKPIMSIPLSNISLVLNGMPSKLQKTFLISDIERSFHLVLRGESKAGKHIISILEYIFKKLRFYIYILLSLKLHFSLLRPSKETP